ncbi:hypothetical protein [Bradyrhizobium vignae]|uniref:hypothetical protein n=1 Tax=Bradyrhizobium vignae TaxID=1549949 RepID=UPI00100A41FD|nr:hypothetical protein [Bradyrhizobium vignae]RXG91888.1 hypothetical protein EAV90_27665 [Bradyrhizobium vignae]
MNSIDDAPLSQQCIGAAMARRVISVMALGQPLSLPRAGGHECRAGAASGCDLEQISMRVIKPEVMRLKFKLKILRLRERR